MSGGRPTRWSVAKCQFVLLCAAALSDRRLALEEREEVRALVGRSPSMQEMSATAKDEIWNEVLAQYEHGDWERHVKLALASLPRDRLLAKAIYTQCADIVFADRMVKRAESQFLARLAKSLSLPRADRALIDEVMAMKNRH